MVAIASLTASVRKIMVKNAQIAILAYIWFTLDRPPCCAPFRSTIHQVKPIDGTC
jgi:hypothetical protein